MPTTKKHHFVPQHYLRRFQIVNSNEKIMVYNKDSGKIFESSIKTTGEQFHFYTITNEEGENDNDLLEQYFCKEYETPTENVLKKICEKLFPSDDDRIMLSRYIAITERRGQKGMKRRLSYIDQNINQAEKEFIELELPLVDRIATIKIINEMRNRPKDRFTKLSLMMEGWLWVIICKMRWRFIVTPQNRGFITSDSPVYFDRSKGLGNKFSYLYFPISPSIALYADWKKNESEGFFQITEKQVNVLNKIIAKNAIQYIYYSEKIEWVELLLKRCREIQFKLKSDKLDI